ncbi:MAG TPA: hypothetical protein VF549_09040 [Solirubrobacteraceae bacterium]
MLHSGGSACLPVIALSEPMARCGATTRRRRPGAVTRHAPRRSDAMRKLARSSWSSSTP